MKEPVAAAKNNKIVYLNPAAEMQLGDVLSQQNSAELLEGGVITLNDTKYNVTVSNAFEHSVYFFAPEAPTLLSDKLLQQISSRLKEKVAELKLTANMLTPYAENNADEKTVAFSKKVSKQAAVLHRMVGNLGYFESFDSVSFFPTTFDMAQCIGNIIDSVPAFVGSSCPQLIFECSGGDMTVQADREKIELALYQLLSNSLKHTPSDGKITVSLAKHGDKFNLTVTDTGCGLSSSQLADLWNVGNSGLTADCGVGVGLPMVRHIAMLHGGQAILTSSENGTSVMLSLPAVQPGADSLHTLSAKYESGLADLMLQLSEVIPTENFCSKFMD